MFRLHFWLKTLFLSIGKVHFQKMFVGKNVFQTTRLYIQVPIYIPNGKSFQSCHASLFWGLSIFLHFWGGAVNKMVRNRLLMQLLRTAVVWMRLDVIFFVTFDSVCGRSLIYSVQRCHLTLFVWPSDLCFLFSVSPCIPQPKKAQILQVVSL